MRSLSTLGAIVALLTGLAGAPAVASAIGTADAHADAPSSLAVIGDTPYDDAQAQVFPGLVASSNADPAVRTVVHRGDIKSGQPCTDRASAAGARCISPSTTRSCSRSATTSGPTATARSSAPTSRRSSSPASRLMH